MKLKQKINDSLTIALEGKLTNADVLSNDLKEIFNEKEDRITELVFDMEEVVTINEECFKFMEELGKKYKINFNNCSLYIEKQIESITKTLKIEEN